MRDSQYKSCAVQNQLTAYLIAAIRNYKRMYLRRISTALRTELPMEGHSEVMELCEETDFFCGLPLMQRLENERLFAAMQGLSERERYIFLSKVLGEMSLSEIALSLGITYGAAAMSYHRTVLRLRNAVGGGKGERFHGAVHECEERGFVCNGGTSAYVLPALIQGIRGQRDL